MQPHFEKVDFGDASFLVFERRAAVLKPWWHYHPEFQITLMVDGYGRRFVGDSVQEYGPGDLVLLGSNLPHTWQSSKGPANAVKVQHAVDVQFRGEWLSTSLFKSQELRPISALLRRAACGLSFGDSAGRRVAAERLLQLPALPPARRVIGILEILLCLSGKPSTGDSSMSCAFPPEVHRANIDAMRDYLVQNFETPIDFAEMARRYSRSQTSLCRFFKRNAGCTITEFVNGLRVDAAADMLLDTNLGLAEIAFKSGFGNYSNFHRQFRKRKGQSPRDLRLCRAHHSPVGIRVP